MAALERAQANLKRYKASVLKAACEGRLVPTEAELHRRGAVTAPLPYEPADQLLARILAERRAKWEAEHPGKKYKEPPRRIRRDLPELPEGWVWATVDVTRLILKYWSRSESVHSRRTHYSEDPIHRMKTNDLTMDVRVIMLQILSMHRLLSEERKRFKR